MNINIYIINCFILISCAVSRIHAATDTLFLDTPPDSSKIEIINLKEAPNRPIAKTSIGVGLIPLAVFFDVAGVILLSDYAQNPDGFLADLSKVIGSLSLVAGNTLTCVSCILLVQSKREWNEYHKWKNNVQVSVGFRFNIIRVN